ncbi:uncharacterized protein PSFLO_06281 [Pseudozyma flocculosa]|uniref:HTH La-type RNA-binding domain-containing protein n=1 Tax=Pseudozyma flocculosa TaxID=84751 RepID=A0A5C3FBQ0_9BASI|nr:uncharacterized protein PSFLO_06281 [Pseudozyma flocculosa]
MSAWSSAAGKPHLSYAERLRNAAKPPPSANATSPKNEPAPSRIINANISQQQRPLASLSRSSHDETAKPPAVNIWEARKKQLAEKEAEKERLRQQQAATQKKASVTAASAAGSTSKPSKNAAAAASVSSTSDSTTAKTKQVKAPSAAGPASSGQKGKQERASKAGSAGGSASSEKKQPAKGAESSAPAVPKAQIAAKVSLPQGAAQGQTPTPGDPSAPSSSMDATSSGAGRPKVESASQRSHTQPGDATAEVPASAAAGTGGAGRPLQPEAQSPASGAKLVKQDTAKQAAATQPNPRSEVPQAITSGTAQAPAQPLAGSTPASTAAAADATPDEGGVAAGTEPTASVEAAIERELQAVRPPSAVDDDAWLARIHLLNGGQNMPKYGDYGPGGKGFGIGGGLQGSDGAMSEADMLAAKKAERAVAAAWGAGKNVWQKSQQQRQAQQQQSTAPSAYPSPSQQPGPSGTHAVAPSAVVIGCSDNSSAVRLVDPSALAGQAQVDASSASKKKRRPSSAARQPGTRPETTLTEAGKVTTIDNPDRRDGQRSRAELARAGEASTSETLQRASTSSSAQKGPSGQIAVGDGGHAVQGSGKKSKQAASVASNASQASQAQSSGKKGQAGKASQSKPEANKAGVNQASQQQQKKGQQGAGSKGGKTSQPPTEGADGASPLDASLRPPSARSQVAGPSQQDSGKSFGAKGGESVANAAGTPLSSKVASRRINGLVSESSGLSSGQNSVAGSPRARPAHLPATPPPPASFPPRNDSSVAQPMSISASAQHFAQGALGVSASPRASPRVSHATHDASHSPSKATDASRPNAGAGPPSSSSNASAQDSWRGGSSTPKRGRGAARGSTRGAPGGRGGSRGGAPDTFSTHATPASRERRPFNGSSNPESPLAGRTYPRASAQYQYYSGFVPAYMGEAVPETAMAYDGGSDQAGYGNLQMYASPSSAAAAATAAPGQGYFGQVQTPMSAQWARYYANTASPQDVFSQGGGMIETTSQTGAHVPAGSTQQLLTQIEFYFSQRNLLGDFFLRQRMDSQGWVDIATVASFKRVQQVTTDLNTVRDTLLYSAVLDVDVERMKVRKRFGWEAFVLPEDWKAPELAAASASAAGQSQAMHPNGSSSSAAGAGGGGDGAVGDSAGPGAAGEPHHHLAAHGSHHGYSPAQPDVANSATPSKVSTAMSSPPSSFTRASQDEREAAEDGGGGDDCATPAGLQAAEGARRPSSSKEDEYMNLGIVAASGLGGTLSSLATSCSSAQTSALAPAPAIAEVPIKAPINSGSSSSSTT